MSDHSRTTIDLIEELDREARKFLFCAIAVGFESTTVFVFSNDPDRLQQLNEAVSHGGEPIGMLGATIQEDSDGETGTLTIHKKVLREHAHEEEALNYLNRLLASFAARLGQEPGFGTAKWRS